MLTSLFVNAAFAPQVAIPAQIIYKERPVLEQVNAKQLAKKLLTKKQHACLTKLLGKESAWNPKAQNPKSSAKGIGQLLDGTYRNLGMRHSQASVSQLVATLAYIHRRHITPCNAWAFFKARNYY